MVYLYESMKQQPQGLDRLDLQFVWGAYLLRVLRCHLTVFPPGRTISFHKHSEYEFHFIPRGKGKVILIDKEYVLHPGMFYLTGPGVMHYQEADAAEAMEELCLHIQITRQPDDRTIGSGPPHIDLEMQEAEECMNLLEQFPVTPLLDRFDAMSCFLSAYRAWNHNELGQFTTIRQSMIQILLRAVRVMAADFIPAALPARDMNTHRFQLAVKFIQDNSGSPLKLADVADKLQISLRQLQRIFNEQCGQSYSRFLEDIRLEKVCRLLVGSEMTVESIALEQGFSSGEYLHHVFKKHFGVTPKDYRRQRKDGVRNK